MEKMFFRRVLLLAVMVLASVSYSDNGISKTGEEKGDTETCIKKIRITRGQNPFREWDAKSVGSGQAAAAVRAADLQGHDFVVLPGLSLYMLEGGNLMEIEKKTGEPVVSAKCFSPLARVDATRIEPGQRREVGKLLCAPGRDFSLRDLVLFLLESQIITTYWHIESALCLVSEDDSPGIYKASFRGTHTYFTNTRNEDKLDFSITINRKTGAIVLLGGS